jgi:RNA polymerase sigma-70 factor (ECF subfamily)
VGGFETTHWSTVLAAGGQSTTRSREALAALCETYWYPLYAYLRRQGHSAEDAEDLTQGFFARVIEKGVLQVASPERGRFRSFLLASLKHYVANEQDHARALKRGGSFSPLSLEFESARGRYSMEPHDASTPETLFDRRWALTVLDRVMGELRAEFRQRGKEEVFERLKVNLIGEESPFSYRETASKFGMSEDAVRVAVHRLRRRFGELLRAEIAQTVTTDDEVEEEIHYLIRALKA